MSLGLQTSKTHLPWGVKKLAATPPHRHQNVRVVRWIALHCQSRALGFELVGDVVGDFSALGLSYESCVIQIEWLMTRIDIKDSTMTG